MRVRSKSRFNTRSSKRKNETESSFTEESEPPPKRSSKRNEGEQKESSSSLTRASTALSSVKESSSSVIRTPTVLSSVKVDKFCWLCHDETDDKICVTCHRAFHEDCLDKISASFSELGVCPECQSKSVDGTELSSNRFFTVDKLKRMLDVLTRRSFDKKRGKNEIFLGWPEEDRDKVFKIIDFEILLDNINHVPPYTKTAEFYGDVKFIYHNSCIAYGVDSDQAKAAENLRKDFKTELLDLEACPECYYHLYCDEADCYDPFIRLCDSPHDIVWAQLHGHPYWPAKCLKVVKGIAHVRFFGEHERSNIPMNKCFYLSESHPKNKNSNIFSSENSGPKSQRFKSARTELLRYIRLYERKYGAFPFYPHKTPYKPQEKKNDVIILSAEGSSRNMVQMKLEGIANEDPEANVINATTVMEFSEENITSPNSVINDSPTDITSSTVFVRESFKELFQKSCQPEGNKNDGLINVPSRVRHINMSFYSDENPSNIESGTKNPVVTSIESLQPTESPPTAIPSSNDTPLDCDFRILENLNGLLSSQGSKVTETVHCTEILSQTAANNTLDNSTIQPDSLCNIMNNLSALTQDQSELDDEVHYIGQTRNIEVHESFNPAIILPFLEEHCPDLKSLAEKAKYMVEGVIINLYASLFKSSDNIARLSKVWIDLRKCRSELKKMEEENIKVKEEETKNKSQIQNLMEQLRKIQAEKSNLLNRIKQEEAISNEARENARTIIRSLKSGCSKRMEEVLKKQYLDTIAEKEKKLQEAENMVKSLEEEKEHMEKELEEARVATQSAEEKLHVMRSQKCDYDSDDISIFKKMHYCCVCELSAAFVCCLNTSYCSQKCQEEHAEEHRPHCKREISSQIVQQTVCEKTVVYSVKERSTAIRNSSNSQEISNPDSVKGSTHHKKAEVSTSTEQTTPHDHVIPASSRSSGLKSKRRSHR